MTRKANTSGISPSLALRTLGFLTLAPFILAVLFASVLAPYGPEARFSPYAEPSAGHPLGTNDIGNDILSELVYAARVSLFAGLGAGILASGLGLILGLIAGYARGLPDELISGLSDVFLMIPKLPLLIVLQAFLNPGITRTTLILGLLLWPQTARVVRAKTLQVRESPFVAAARALGFSGAKILFSDILPHVRSIWFSKFMLSASSGLLAEASVSFLGLGDPGVKSWGMMLNYAFKKGGFVNGAVYWYLPPGLCVMGLSLALLLIGFSFEERRVAVAEV
jgi:peptide/nickel transport system permease protein